MALQNRDAKQKFNKRTQQVLPPYHLLANIMHQKYRGQSLTEAE